MSSATEKSPLLSAQSFDLLPSKARINRKVVQMQSTISTKKCNDDYQNLRQNLTCYYESLKGWNLHYDYDLWDQAELYLGQVWQNLRSALHLAMEYGLYEEVKAVFLEIRHPLQIAGFVKDRIYLAAWLKAEAKRREDWVTQYLMTSSLAWAYTSCGCYQNLKKANALWNELTPFLSKVGEPSALNDYRSYLQDRQDLYPYGELLIDIYETGVRIAVRCARFEDVSRYVRQGKAEITALSKGGFLPARLKERFDLAFSYHEGVAYYLMGQYERAQNIFEKTVERGSFIAWARLVKGAQSWLATIAMELEQYSVCESILSELVDSHSPVPGKRAAICHLISAQLSGKLGEEGAKAESEKKAESVLKHFGKESDSRCVPSYDVKSLRLQQPVLCPMQ